MIIRQQNGFTLIELMITLVILAIITAFAYPQYRNYIVQTRRAEATTALSQIAALEEKFFTECAAGGGAAQIGYTTNLAGSIQLSGASPRCSGLGYITGGPPVTPNGYYTITIASNPNVPPPAVGVPPIAVGYLITATPVAGTTQVGDGGIRISSTGIKEWDKANNSTFTSPWPSH